MFSKFYSFTGITVPVGRSENKQAAMFDISEPVIGYLLRVRAMIRTNPIQLRRDERQAAFGRKGIFADVSRGYGEKISVERTSVARKAAITCV